MKGDQHHNGGNTKFAPQIWPLYCKADVLKFLNIIVKVTKICWPSLYSYQNNVGFWFV